ncbi:hypothetical protein [Frankia sp. Cr2]|uniref:hypothetical protein n=1 Tax=Frankia sp. Cr2 TaxID=3073932 RepID=UPI002AD38AD8|nr:hypothetical protein [Frankia sp. Cr2]
MAIRQDAQVTATIQGGPHGRRSAVRPTFGLRPPPAPPQKKSGLGKKILIGFGVFIALIIVVTVANGGSKSTTSTSATSSLAEQATPTSAATQTNQAPPADTATQPSQTEQTSQAEPATADRLFEHPEDVQVTGCARDATLGWPKATLTITNKSSKASSYSVTVSFQSADGSTQYGEGVAFVSSLAPGQKTVQAAQGTDDIPARSKLVCKVTSAKRTEAF